MEVGPREQSQQPGLSGALALHRQIRAGAQNLSGQCPRVTAVSADLSHADSHVSG